MKPDFPLLGKENDRNTLLAEERTKLAAERTFLAWIRTGLTSIGIGLALTRFIIFHTSSHQRLGHLVGQLLILWGICIFGFALVSYKRMIRQFHPSTIGIPFMGLNIFTMGLIVLSFILFWIVLD